MTFSAYSTHRSMTTLFAAERKDAKLARREPAPLLYASWYPLAESMLPCFRIISLLLFRLASNHAMQKYVFELTLFFESRGLSNTGREVLAVAGQKRKTYRTYLTSLVQDLDQANR
jgi:hypothetical protein